MNSSSDAAAIITARLANFDQEQAVPLEHRGRSIPYDDEIAARNAAAGHPSHTAVSRLVGTRQPADGQHDPNPPVTYPVVSNDTDRGLTC